MVVRRGAGRPGPLDGKERLAERLVDWAAERIEYTVLVATQVNQRRLARLGLERTVRMMRLPQVLADEGGRNGGCDGQLVNPCALRFALDGLKLAPSAAAAVSLRLAMAAWR